MNKAGITELIIASPRPWHQSLFVAFAFAIEAAACTALLWFGYSKAHAPEVAWAIVSAFLVLQPEFSQSLVIAFSRMAANLIGAAVGLLIAQLIGIGPGGMIVAIFIASLICGLLRIDLALRTACVAIIIVMSSHENIVHSGTARFASVSIGCVTAIIIQILLRPLTCKFEITPTIHRSPVKAPATDNE